MMHNATFGNDYGVEAGIKENETLNPRGALCECVSRNLREQKSLLCSGSAGDVVIRASEIRTFVVVG